MSVARIEVFNRLLDVVEQRECSECIAHDQSRPGANTNGRYAVIAQGDSGRTELTRCDREHAQIVAESHLDSGWTILGMYDLDTLAGEAPPIYEGDVVRLVYEDNVMRTNGPMTYTVVRVDEELIEGEIGRYLCLVEEGKPEPEDWDGWDLREHDDNVVLIERGEPDERLPVKYGVAAIIQCVVFNSVPNA